MPHSPVYAETLTCFVRWFRWEAAPCVLRIFNGVVRDTRFAFSLANLFRRYTLTSPLAPPDAVASQQAMDIAASVYSLFQLNDAENSPIEYGVNSSEPWPN